MADELTTNLDTSKLRNPFLTDTGELDLEGLSTRYQETIDRLREPVIPGAPTGPGAVGKPVEDLFKKYGVEDNPLAKEAWKNLQAEKESLQQQADVQATGLETKAAQTISGLERLEQLKGAIETGYGKVADYWDTVDSKADEYVAASFQRMKNVVGKFDEMMAGVGEKMDFAKAHAINSQVAGMVSEMNAVEKDILAAFGRGSPEHQQFLSTKARSAHVAVSNIQAEYDKLSTQMRASLTVERGTLASTMAGYVNYQEKLHVDALTAAAASRMQYELQQGEMLLQVERFRALQLDDFVNSLMGATVFRLDTLSFVNFLADLAEEQAEKINFVKMSQYMRQPNAGTSPGSTLQISGNTSSGTWGTPTNVRSTEEKMRPT